MDKTGIKGLIESVIQDIANNENVNQYALKLQIISRKLKNDIFSNWLSKEINGYGKDDPVPEYRIIKSMVTANLIIDRGFQKAQFSNHTMPLYPLGEELAKEISSIHIRESVIALNKFMEGNEPLACSITDYERVKLSAIYEDCTILSAHKPIQRSDFELIIHKFKSSLLEIFMEFNDTIFDDELDLDLLTKKKSIDKIIQQTINAGIYLSEGSTANVHTSTIVGGVDNKVSVDSVSKQRIEDLLIKIEELSHEIDEDRDDIAAEILKIRTELENTVQQPKVIKSALNALKGITIGVAGNKVTDLINVGLEIVKNM